MITYRLATKEDNEQLIELTAASGMTGDIALRIDRTPNFFELLGRRGESSVFIALDDHRIIGSLCVSLQQVYVGGKVFPLHYIGDFKVAGSYRNKRIGLQLCNELANYLLALNADLAFLNVSKGNSRPFSFFKNRPNIPDFENIGIFNIHQFIGKRKKRFHPAYEVKPAAITDELIKFLN
ncbi:MAG: GNAT family N-acetyltransferase, partial [Ginsengibacter sp.]